MSRNIRSHLTLAMALILGLFWANVSYGAVENYACQFEAGTEFGETIEFGYDLERNIIVLQSHQNGVYQPNFTFGGAEQEGGMLQFVLEHWVDGSVAMRESHSLNFEDMALNSSQDFYAEDGSLSGHGQTATASCTGGAGAGQVVAENSDQTEAPQKPKSSDTAAGVGDVFCHTEEIGAEAIQSASWCVLSKLSAQKEYSYGPENLSGEGAWCEGEEGYGIGVGIEVSFQPFVQGDQPPSFDRLLIANGYDKTTKTFIENSRVRQIEIKTDAGQTWVRTLRDETGVQEVLLGETISPNGILITILGVYEGQKYDDTCLSFVMADFGF